MGGLMRFVMTLLANLAWQRIGGRGAVPPVRLPRSKQPINFPVLTPWQMMVAMWAARKAWDRYGHQVKSKIDAVNHPAARQVGAWLPDPDLAVGAAPTAPSNPAPRTWTTTAQPAPASPKASTATPSATPSATAGAKSSASPSSNPRDYGTRRLDEEDAPTQKPKTPFAGWRRSSGG